MSDKAVDYLDLIACAAAEERVERDWTSVLPDSAGEKVVDYLAVSKAWREERGLMDHGIKED